MKKYLIPLFLCLLLCGCDAGDRGITHVSGLSTPAEASQPESGPNTPDTLPENPDSGALRFCPLPMEQVTGMRAMGQGLLVFSGEENTTLTLLQGDPLSVAAQTQLEGCLRAEDPSLRIGDGTLSFFLEETGQVLVLDGGLRLLCSITAPGDILGCPLLSADLRTVYYCTGRGILAWELDRDIHRLLKELDSDSKSLEGLYINGTVLQCRVREGDREEHLFLSTGSGQLLQTFQGNIRLRDCGDRFYARFPNGSTQTLAFGTSGSDVQALIPEDLSAAGVFLETLDSAVTLSAPEKDSVRLDHYALDSGRRTASVTLPEGLDPTALAGCADGYIYLLARKPDSAEPALYRWDRSRSPVPDTAVYTARHYTAADPDLEGLERCRQYAAALSRKHGINILVWKDAVAVQPWDYDLTPEHLVSVITEELLQLDSRLSCYPREILEQTAGHYSSFSVCLVRELSGTAESGSLDSAAGIQFLNGTDAYVVLAVGPLSDRTLYHELFHTMETHLLGNTASFDRWDALNPTGFSYDYSYLTNKTRDAGVYLQNADRAFVDTYSMSYPREDRARIMEYAMLPGNRALFQSAAMQRKLRTLCEGIREAYGLTDHNEPFLWEQYLQ